MNMQQCWLLPDGGQLRSSTRPAGIDCNKWKFSVGSAAMDRQRRACTTVSSYSLIFIFTCFFFYLCRHTHTRIFYQGLQKLNNCIANCKWVLTSCNMWQQQWTALFGTGGWFWWFSAVQVTQLDQLTAARSSSCVHKLQSLCLHSQ